MLDLPAAAPPWDLPGKSRFPTPIPGLSILRSFTSLTNFYLKYSRQQMPRQIVLPSTKKYVISNHHKNALCVLTVAFQYSI